MSSVEIKNNVHSIGVLNPNLRVFDIIMKAEYGTSYNSYLVKGSEKTAIIEASHEDYKYNFIDNIKNIVDINEISYIIMNHNEPDHSGSLEYLLELNPNIKVVTSKAGELYLRNITNRTDIDIITVKTGDTISLGDKTLEFIIAPFLHWPDSMFTYLKEDKFLFSCDFLGAHYCEPYVFDYKINFENSYKDALKNYYDCIFAPFPEYVRQGLNKIDKLDIEYACTSHGPILSKSCQLNYVLEKYREWSKENTDKAISIPIFYASAYGYTKALAEEIKNGIKSVDPSIEVETFDIIKYDIKFLSEKMNNSTGFLIGSPTLNKVAVEPVWRLLSHLDTINNQKKPVAVFGSYGWSGEAVPLLHDYLSKLKFNVVLDGLKVCFKPSGEDLKIAKDYGVKYANKLIS